MARTGDGVRRWHGRGFLVFLYSVFPVRGARCTAVQIQVQEPSHNPPRSPTPSTHKHERTTYHTHRTKTTTTQTHAEHQAGPGEQRPAGDKSRISLANTRARAHKHNRLRDGHGAAHTATQHSYITHAPATHSTVERRIWEKERKVTQRRGQPGH